MFDQQLFLNKQDVDKGTYKQYSRNSPLTANPDKQQSRSIFHVIYPQQATRDKLPFYRGFQIGNTEHTSSKLQIHEKGLS